MESNNEKATAEVNPDALRLPVWAIALENRVGGINNDVWRISVSGYVYCIQYWMSTLNTYSATTSATACRYKKSVLLCGNRLPIQELRPGA